MPIAKWPASLITSYLYSPLHSISCWKVAIQPGTYHNPLMWLELGQCDMNQKGNTTSRPREYNLQCDLPHYVFTHLSARCRCSRWACKPCGKRYQASINLGPKMILVLSHWNFKMSKDSITFSQHRDREEAISNKKKTGTQ